MVSKLGKPLSEQVPTRLVDKAEPTLTALMDGSREVCPSGQRAYSRFGNMFGSSPFSRLFDVLEGTPEPSS